MVFDVHDLSLDGEASGMGLRAEVDDRSIDEFVADRLVWDLFTLGGTT
jgi:hypothetical protein